MEVYADIHNGSWVKSNSILPDGTPKHGNCKIIPITEAEYMLEMI